MDRGSGTFRIDCHHLPGLYHLSPWGSKPKRYGFGRFQYDHLSRTAIEEHNGRVDEGMNVAKGLLDLLIGVLQGTAIRGVCHEVLRSWSQSCQSFLFRKNVCVDFSATNPDDLGLIGADQIF